MSSDPMTARPRPTVLVIDNNADMNRFVADRLADTYCVVSAHSTADALALAAERAPDLVIADATMTAFDGADLVSALRARPELAAVLIVMLTAGADEDTRVRLLRAGAQDYITTPIVVEELRARVATLVAIKRTKDVLKEGLAADGDLETLARAQMAKQQELDLARQGAERESRSKDEFLSVV